MAGKVGRPKKILTEDQLKLAEKLAADNHTNEQIAEKLGICVDTIERSELYSGVIKKGKQRLLAKVKRTAYEIALQDRNPAMIMFILKCRGGWREKQDIDITHGFKPIIIQRSDGSQLVLGMSQTKKGLDDGKEEETGEG
jgi:hypothetical protein